MNNILHKVGYRIILMGDVSMTISPRGWDVAEYLDRSLTRYFRNKGISPRLFRCILPEEYEMDCCTIVLYMMKTKKKCLSPSDRHFLRRMQMQGVPIIPILSKKLSFDKNHLNPLCFYQALIQEDNMSFPKFALARILELFRLSRYKRRIFISYRRKEADQVAMQLHQMFSSIGWSSFLDTENLRGGEKSQEYLYQELYDSDIVIFLNSPKAYLSPWVREELEKRSLQGMPILQICWPQIDPLNICLENRFILMPFFFQDNIHEKLKPFVLKRIRYTMQSLALHADSLWRNINMGLIQDKLPGVLDSNSIESCIYEGNGIAFKYNQHHYISYPHRPRSKELFRLIGSNSFDKKIEGHMLCNTLGLTKETFLYTKWLGDMIHHPIIQ